MKTLVAVLAFVPLFATAAQPPSVPWACGGVSAEERRALPAEVPGANLELLFVQGKRGAYTSGTQWRIFDRANEPIAYGTSDGPQCFLQLPEGTVRVEARLGGEVKTARASIRAGDRRARLAFTFAAVPDEEIEASPEEKAQARQ